MSEQAQDTKKWLEAQINAAGKLVTMGSKALRQGHTAQGAQVLTEAEAILDMAEMETDRLLKMRARVFNELGVVYQRRNQLKTSRDYHGRAAEICDALIAGGDDFAANSAATYLNLSSIHLALGDQDEARSSGEHALSLLEELDSDDASGDDEQPKRKGPDPLELGARQNLAVIYAREADWSKANEMMDKASDLAHDLAAAGRPDFLAQLAQGCQQLSVIQFENDRFDDALRWGNEAEKLSEKAYEALGQKVLPVYIISQINLISYNEKLGRFADAEDCLWKALDVAGNNPRILQRGVAFYETCRKQADPRLEEGNLPREEVQDGYEELMERVEAAGGVKAVREMAKQSRQRR